MDFEKMVNDMAEKGTAGMDAGRVDSARLRSIAWARTLADTMIEAIGTLGELDEKKHPDDAILEAVTLVKALRGTLEDDGSNLLQIVTTPIVMMMFDEPRRAMDLLSELGNYTTAEFRKMVAAKKGEV